MEEPKALIREVQEVLRSECLAPIPRERLDSVEELLTHREWGIAVENLCANIFDFDVVVDREVADTLEHAVRSLQLDPSYLDVLRRVRRR